MTLRKFVCWVVAIGAGVVVLSWRTAHAVTSSWLSPEAVAYNFALAWVGAMALGSMAVDVIFACVTRRKWEQRRGKK